MDIIFVLMVALVIFALDRIGQQLSLLMPLPPRFKDIEDEEGNSYTTSFSEDQQISQVEEEFNNIVKDWEKD